MAISKQDMEELRRIVTNTYDNDKAFMRRVIMGIGLMESENNKLKAQVEVLKKQIESKV